MPIRPELRHHYQGPKWEATRRTILERAGYCCEQCGKPDRKRVATDNQGNWCLPTATQWRDAKGRPIARPNNGTTCRFIDVVLTVAHVNHTPGDDQPYNLRAWCQRCHLLHDHAQHVRNASATRRARLNNQELPL